jgi:hypothetical protein
MSASFRTARVPLRQRVTGVFPSAHAVSELAQSLAFLAAIGLIAIGLSGLLAAGFGAAYGKGFVSGDVAGVTYTPARCADYFEYEQAARTCEQAATLHHFGEVVFYREAAGVLGLAALGSFFVIQRFNRRFGSGRALPEGFTVSIGAALFGLAAFGLLGLGLGPLIIGRSTGIGQYLSGGVVAFFVFIGFAIALLRVLRGAPKH